MQDSPLSITRQLVEDSMQPDRSVDVYAVAAQLQPHYPDLSLKDIAAIVSEITIGLNGNAMWNLPEDGR